MRVAAALVSLAGARSASAATSFASRVRVRRLAPGARRGKDVSRRARQASRLAALPGYRGTLMDQPSPTLTPAFLML